MTTLSSESESPPLLRYILGLLSGFAVVAVILGLLAYSLLAVIGPSGGRANTAGVAPNSRGADISHPRAALVPPVSSTLVLCNGRTLLSIGNGPFYHVYIEELLGTADETGRPATCLRIGRGGDDFR